jgi:hypothetical protein
MKNQLFVLVPSITQRLLLVMDHFASNYWNAEIHYILNPNEIIPEQMARFSLSPHPIQGWPTIPAHSLLFSTEKTDSIFINHDGLPAKYPTDFAYPYDVFSAAFFLISRMQQETSCQRDSLNRFPASASILATLGMYENNIVGFWAYHFQDWLIHQFPFWKKYLPNISTQITVDVDHLYRVKGRTFFEVSRGIVGSFRKGNFSEGWQRWLTYVDPAKKDAFDTFEKYPENSILFIQMGMDGKWNKSMGIGNEAFRKKIKELSGQFTIGLHPSTKAAFSFEHLVEEKNDLEEIIEKKVIHSRQHYLFGNASTWQHLMQLGITHEFTGLAADLQGFQLGTSFPVPFYDFRQEKITSMMIYPSTWMDATAYFYLKQDFNQMQSHHQKMKEATWKYGGVWCPLYHNNYEAFLD